MLSSFTWRSAAPILKAAPGMPQTTLVASSWTMVWAPALRISSRPRAPSSPMPVRMQPTALAPAKRVTDLNSTSTLGR